MNIPLLLIIIGLFVIILASYSIKKVDYLSIAIICCLVAATLTAIFTDADYEFFLNEIGFQAIIVIFCMNIITNLATKSNILEYLAIKLFKISKGNNRTFFYLLCFITTLLAAIISDVVVAIILAPIVIRLCRILKIKAGTHLLGMALSINIGSILTPFSSGKNIVISTTYGLDTLYFVQHYWIFAFFLWFITIFIMDRMFLKEEPEIDRQQKKYVIELINGEIIIKDRRIFFLNSIAIIVTIVFFVIIPELYLVALFSAFILILLNRGFTKKKAGEILRELEWEVLFFFIALYIVVACLKAAGFKEVLLLVPFEVLSTPLMVILLLLVVSIINAFVANNPTALFLIPFIDILIGVYDFPSVPVLFAFIFAINLGGNFLPSGCTCNVFLLNTAQENNVENLDYRRFLIVGAAMTGFHLLLTMGYLFIISFFYI
ncbi:MAG: Arsenical pump membrane protein [Promethearchaeota archaeon]|nr:MAG: Arsenical pump membrane protein [Candidatus Lokiarchaeota archaeon]